MLNKMDVPGVAEMAVDRQKSLFVSIKGPHKATHGQGETISQHSHRGQQTLCDEVPQSWGAKIPLCLKVVVLNPMDVPGVAELAPALLRQPALC